MSSAGTPTADERQRALDRLAERVLARLAPLTFSVATTPAERDAVLRMRYECVVGMGWARPEDHPDGRERDEHDADAIFIVGRENGTTVGSLRLILPTPGLLLPTERDSGIRVRPLGGVAEAGRIIVAPSARRGRSHLILAGLCARGWFEACAHGYDQVVSTAAADVLDFYRGLGLRITVLGPAQKQWGERRVPVRVEGDPESFGFLAESERDR